jgi:membrane-associated protein
VLVLSEALRFLAGLPPFSVYAFLGIGAALENIVPPVPADTFVVVGGLLATQGRVRLLGVFLATWSGNVASALAVYAAWMRYGPEFFRGGLGRYLLKPRQIERLAEFYGRWGVWAIFLSRFLPGFRAIVPVFAGVTRQRFLAVAIPIAAASAIWYGLLTWLGGVTGRNLDTILGWLGGLNRTLLIVALLLAAAVGTWWYRTRRESDNT